MVLPKKFPIPLPPGAVPAPLPGRLSPHLAVLGEMPTHAAEWIFEIKYDGYRMLAHVDRDVRLYTRNGRDWTSKLPLMRAQIEALQLSAGWYDGELVACDDRGQQARRQAYCDGRRSTAWRKLKCRQHADRGTEACASRPPSSGR